ncbi:MAG TPA: ATP-binding protein [Actinocrinis sp.]|nr:ATP-binding protein [Actinocrinis sp.]
MCTDHDEGFHHSFPADPLGPGAGAVSAGRHYVRDCLAGIGAEPAVTEVVTLLASEVLTNAVLYGPPPVEVRVHLVGERVRVSVIDSTTAPPVMREGDATGGWGLHLVERGAVDWGYHLHGPGKCVWFEADLKSDAPDPALLLAGK